MVKHLAHHVVVMYCAAPSSSRATADEVFAEPQHEYTRRLLAAVPQPDVAALASGDDRLPWFAGMLARHAWSCRAARQAPTTCLPGRATAVGAASDINPQDPATLREGGDLRLALTEFPSNFNTLHIDGNSADVGAMLKATMPRAFVIGPDGSTTVDTDYFTSVELTGTNPQVVTYTINPKAAWSDGTPLTWEDIASQVHATSGADKNFAIAGTNGSERVESVTRGVDDRQAVITFAKPYAEWRGHVRRQHHAAAEDMTATPKRSTRPS